MARTFNRNPMSMPMPSKSDIQDYYFSHSEFKGLDDTKNYLTVDPNTFADCKNVYVDLEGLLKSRPVIKNKQVLITTSSNNTTELNDILNVYTFGKITVYHTDKKLTIYNPDKSNCLQMSLPNNDIKPILAEGKVFIFTSSKIMYYDCMKHTVYTSNASDYIYVPITKLVTNGSESDFEQPNELTTSYKIRYLFTHVEGSEEVKNNYEILNGKTLTFTIDGNTYTRTFTENTKYTLVHKISMPTTNSNLIISIADNGYIMLALKNTGDTRYTIWYSYDGLGYKSFYGRTDAVSIPSISADGKYVCCASEDEIYIAKIMEDADGDTEKWEKLQHSYQSDAYTNSVRFVSSSSVKMLTKDDYAVIAKLLRTSTLDPGDELICIVCFQGVRIVRKFKRTHTQIYGTNDVTKTCTVTFNKNTVINDGVQVKGLEMTGAYWTSVDGWDGYIIPAWTGKCVINNNVPRLYIASKGSVYTSRYIAENSLIVNKTTKSVTEVLIPTANFVIIDDFKVSYTKTETQTDITFTIAAEPLHTGYKNNDMYMDTEYPLGSTFCSYLSTLDDHFTYVLNAFNGRCPVIDMHVEGGKYYVAANYGEIFVINSDSNSIFFVDNPWRSVYNMRLYDVSITANTLRYTCPANVTSTNSIVCRTFEYKDGEYVHVSDLSINTTGKSAVSKDGKVLVKDKMYIDDEPVNLLFNCTPVCFTKAGTYLLGYSDNVLYSDAFAEVTKFDETVQGSYNYITPEHVSEIGNFYVSKDNTLYISSYPAEGDFKWYFPKINTEVFDQDIHGLHPTSATEMAVLLQDGVYNIQTSESGYLYYKTKIQVGIKNGAGIVTSYDGKYTMFPTYRGMVALTYQDFVATTEQVLTFLTDSILQTFKEYYSTDSIKLFKYDFWLVCYKPGNNKYLVFDMRNNSWWPMELLYNIDKFVLIDDKVHVLCNGKLYNFVHDNDNYYDDNSYINEVEWYITSQPLHLNAPNNYKHISSITLTSMLDSDVDLYFDLILYNYRKKLHKSDVDSFKFKVDTVRSYVKRLNYSKVGKFQYLLTSILNDAADDYEDAARTPLSISNITIKYKVSGQVR